MLIALDIQHRGKPNKWDDRGAAANGRDEVDYTTVIANAADEELRRLGYDVVVLSDDHYAERWGRAHQYQASCYIALHMNAGGGDRCEVYWDYRSPLANGYELARLIAHSMRQGLGWRSEAKEAKEGMNAWNVIEGLRPLKPVGITFEPYFLDGPRAQLAWEARELIGRQLALGIHNWAQAR